MPSTPVSEADGWDNKPRRQVTEPGAEDYIGWRTKKRNTKGKRIKRRVLAISTDRQNERSKREGGRTLDWNRRT